MREIYDETNQKLAHLMQSDFYQGLKKILAQKPAPTLRQIKEQLGNKIDKDLDFLIEKGIVKRQDRRYYLGMIEHPQIEESKKISQLTQVLLSQLKSKSQTELALYLCNLLQKTSSETYLLADEQMYAFYQEIGNKRLKIVTIATEEWTQTLPSYFAYLQTEEKCAVFTEMENLLGDVDPDYYLDQLFLLVEKRGEIPHKNNIFLTSLKLFDLVSTQARLTFKVPLIKASDLVKTVPEFALNDFERHAVVANILTALGYEQLTLMILL